MEEFNKMDALKYLVRVGPEYTNEWTEAGMYNVSFVGDVVDKKSAKKLKKVGFNLPTFHEYSDGCTTGWYVCKKCGDMY